LAGRDGLLGAGSAILPERLALVIAFGKAATAVSANVALVSAGID